MIDDLGTAEISVADVLAPLDDGRAPDATPTIDNDWRLAGRERARIFCPLGRIVPESEYVAESLRPPLGLGIPLVDIVVGCARHLPGSHSTPRAAR